MSREERYSAVNSTSKFILMLTVLVGLSLFNGSSSLGSPVLCDSMQILFAKLGPDSSSYAGRTWMAGYGDVNYDGYADFAYTYYLYQGLVDTFRTAVYYGGEIVDTAAAGILRGRMLEDRAIDMNGDGFLDVVTIDVSQLLLYGGSSTGFGFTPIDSMGIDAGLSPNGSWVGVMRDFNRDGIGDLLIQDTDIRPEYPNLVYFDSPFFSDRTRDWSFDPTASGGGGVNRVEIGDITGDGALDILARYEIFSDSSYYVFVFPGPQFPIEPTFRFAPPVGFDCQGSVVNFDRFASEFGFIGDYDGDSHEDLCIVTWGGCNLIYLGGPFGDTTFDIELDDTGDPVIGTGDVNNDHYEDLFMGVCFPNGLRIRIYTGGPRADATTDHCLDVDALPPWSLDLIGYNASWVGDVNNDGVNDYGVSYYDYNLHGGVIVFAGQYSTSTDDEEPSTTPKTATLQQNYPNPFNPQTTIEFSLPTAGSTTLVIYNSTGQVVRNLLNKQLPAGTHRIEWDGKDSSGRELSSGVYLYELEGLNFRESRKMTLIR